MLNQNVAVHQDLKLLNNCKCKIKGIQCTQTMRTIQGAAFHEGASAMST